jgi:hypothetical protein
LLFIATSPINRRLCKDVTRTAGAGPCRSAEPPASDRLSGSHAEANGTLTAARDLVDSLPERRDVQAANRAGVTSVSRLK